MDELGDGVAIIGVAGRFPKARNVLEFWANLKAGREAISFFEPDELELKPDSSQQPEDARFIAAKGVLEDVDLFDAKFWGYTPREAELMDPQQRFFLECAWEAMEDAGYDTARYPGAVGVYAGCYIDTYLLANLCRNRDFLDNLVASIQVGSLQTELGNDKDYIATRVAYKLDLRGPALNVQSACSTSLVAITLAYQSLMSFQCDMALAGGATITLPQKKGYFYTEGGMLSKDGHCRTFDAEAAGTVFSNACGAIALKRLADAVADGDHIYAVLKGAALNNDGAKKLSYTAPSVQGQAEVIAMAQAIAGVDARTIGYVEAHGTATPLGDPIEVAGLTQAFRETTQDNAFCALGSVKSNLGHLDAASGVTGVIKTAMMLHDKMLVPSLNYSAPNPNIDFGNTPFFVNRELREWPERDWPRRAGVSSFGVGGTNAHVVLEEPPAEEALPAGTRPQVLPISARSKEALEAYAAKLASYLAESPARLEDVAYTLQLGRRQFDHRAVVVASPASAAEKLATFKLRAETYHHAVNDDQRVVFMFPGQGAQYPGMVRDLYREFPAFRDEIDRCAAVLSERVGIDLIDRLLNDDDVETVRQTTFAQPAIFAIEYALARLWQSFGVEPTALIGHSVGEYAAACLSGVLSLEDALWIVAKRGEYMQALPPGSMLSIRAPLEDVEPYLGGAIDLAAHNAPQLCVVSGPAEDIAELERTLTAKEIPCSALHTSHAFHSRMMDEALPATLEVIETVRLDAPRIPIMSTVEPGWLTEAQARSPEYWGRNLRNTVRFAEGVTALLDEGYRIFVEAGPGKTLSTLAQQCGRGRDALRAFSSLPHATSQETDSEALLNAFGQLWASGVEVDWERLHSHERRRVSLPTYPFQRRRYWIEPTSAPVAKTAAQQADAPAGEGVEEMQAIIARQIAVMARQIELLK